MVRNKLAMAVLALSVLQANVASALGLGNLAVKSALNQPLNAEIKLLDLGDLDAGQIRIQLGSPDDFQRAAVERDYFLTNLKFTVDLDGHGGGVVHISTREPVVEPYLNFVIEARWPNGRVLREFAVLLDPPTFNANRAAAPVAPAASGAPAAPRPQRAPEPPTVTTEAAPAPAPATAGMALPAAKKDGEYRIQVYDTLSKIAAQHRPAADVSVEQTMLAIQRANPQVFIRNNVNLIKSGYVIRLPSAEEARNLDAAQAASEVEEQVREWRGGSPRSAAATAATTGPQLDARTPEPTDKEGGYKEQARLSIAAPGGSDKSSAGEGSSGTASGKGVEALRNQLTASQESLEKGKRDNKELQSRLDDMERQIATLQRLISLKDDQLAALQAKSAQPDAAPAATPAAPAPVPADSAATATSTTTATTTTTTTTATPATPAPAPAAAAKPAASKPAAPKPAPAPVAEPSLVEQFTSNPLYLGGAGALVLLLAGLAIQRRRKAAEEEREAGEFVLDDHVDFAFDETPDREQVRIDDAAATVVAESAAVERTAETRLNQAAPVRSETGDAIAEADIYIAYGRYQQAVDLLSHAIDAEPSRSDLRVKLLEVCLEMRNREAFRQQFVALQGLGDGDAVAHAKDLLSSVDGVSDWLVDLPQAHQRPANELVASAAVAATAAAAAIAAADSFEHEDLSLDEQAFAEEPSEAFAEPVAAPADAELDLDLDDLGLGDELPADAELELEDELAGLSFDKELNFDKELGDLDLEDDLDLEGELDLDAPLDLADGLDLDKELDLDSGAGLEKEIDLDLDRGLQPAAASADELAEELDLESHPGLDSEFDVEADLEAELPVATTLDVAAPAVLDELGHFESELGASLDSLDDSFLEEKVEYDFQIDDIEDDLAAVPAGATSFDLDSTSIELAGEPSPVVTPEETIGLAAEPKLDLAHDDLELALDEMGETGYLNDLEGAVDALHALDQPAPAAAAVEPAALEGDLSDEFDLGNLDVELPEIDRLDLAAADDLPALQPESAAVELPDLAELPPEFDAAAAALDAENTAADDADDEFDFLADADEIATKLDLARAYIDMGDTDGARDILDEVMQEGTDTQRQEASALLDRIA
jgi:pilus assembly protein FimV